MDAFKFRLARVLQIRTAQQQAEEAKLEKLRREKIQIESNITDLDAELKESTVSTKNQKSVSGPELVALQLYEVRLQRERKEYLGRLAAKDADIRGQQQLVVGARRNVTLLEKLRDKQRADWQMAAAHELETMIAEFTTAQWLRREQIDTAG